MGVSGFTILLFEAVLMCAIEIAENRAGKPEAASAITFLEYISVERLMLFAMLGDAGDEAYQLTVSVESEDFDIANVGSFISSFVAAIDTLFNQRNAIMCGYTKFMTNFLQTPRTFVVRGVPKTLGGAGCVNNLVLDNCYSHMQTFVKLAVASLDAEFPMWSVMQSFSVFDLNQKLDDMSHALTAFLTLRVSPPAHSGTVRQASWCCCEGFSEVSSSWNHLRALLESSWGFLGASWIGFF